jgi:hypothetical protein
LQLGAAHLTTVVFGHAFSPLPIPLLKSISHRFLLVLFLKVFFFSERQKLSLLVLFMDPASSSVSQIHIPAALSLTQNAG